MCCRASPSGILSCCSARLLPDGEGKSRIREIDQAAGHPTWRTSVSATCPTICRTFGSIWRGLRSGAGRVMEACVPRNRVRAGSWVLKSLRSTQRVGDKAGKKKSIGRKYTSWVFVFCRLPRIRLYFFPPSLQVLYKIFRAPRLSARLLLFFVVFAAAATTSLKATPYSCAKSLHERCASVGIRHQMQPPMGICWYYVIIRREGHGFATDRHPIRRTGRAASGRGKCPSFWATRRGAFGWAGSRDSTAPLARPRFST